MSSRLQGITWFPVKGLILSAPPHPLPNDKPALFASGGYDFLVEYATDLKKRDGYSAINATALSAGASTTSLASLYLSNGTKHELIGTDEGRIWEDESGVITSQVFEPATFSVNQPLSYSQFLDTLIVMDGSASARTWDGAASGTISAAPVGKYGELHLNKFFITGIAGNLSRVDYPATGDFATWTGAGTGQFQVNQNDGEINTGLKSFSMNELVVFKQSSMWKILGQSATDFSLYSVDMSVGCVCNRSIKTFRGLMIWAARDGLYTYNGSRPVKISQYIDEFWELMNFTRFEWMDAMVDEVRGLYILSVPMGSDTTNTRLIVVDLLHPWQDSNGLHYPMFPWRITADALNTEVAATNKERLTLGSGGYKFTLSQDYKSDNGASIESYVESPLFSFEGSLGNENCLRRAYIAFINTNGSLTLSTEIKDGGDWIDQETIETNAAGSAAIGVDFEINVSPIGIDEASSTERVDIVARSRRIKVRLLQDSATEYYTMQSPIEFYYKGGGMRG